MPVFLSPSNGGSDSGAEVRLTWNLSDRSDGYQIELSGDDLSNIEEFVLKNSPMNKDTDGDYLHDGIDFEPLVKNLGWLAVIITSILLKINFSVPMVNS